MQAKKQEWVWDHEVQLAEALFREWCSKRKGKFLLPFLFWYLFYVMRDRYILISFPNPWYRNFLPFKHDLILESFYKFKAHSIFSMFYRFKSLMLFWSTSKKSTQLKRSRCNRFKVNSWKCSASRFWPSNAGWTLTSRIKEALTLRAC